MSRKYKPVEIILDEETMNHVGMLLSYEKDFDASYVRAFLKRIAALEKALREIRKHEKQEMTEFQSNLSAHDNYELGMRRGVAICAAIAAKALEGGKE